MFGSRSKPHYYAPLLMLALAVMTSSVALAGDEKQSTMPVCDKKIGTLSVVELEQK